MNESLARDALRKIEALQRENAQLRKALETELAKSRGADRSGLKGVIQQATSGGLPNSFAVPGVDPSKLIDKAAKRGKRS